MSTRTRVISFTVGILIVLAFLLSGCVLTEPGPDGGPSPLSVGVDTAGDVIVDAVSSGDNPTVALVTGVLAGCVAIYGSWRAYKKKRAARKPIGTKINLADPKV
jgi:hypothetical protein